MKHIYQKISLSVVILAFIGSFLGFSVHVNSSPETLPLKISGITAYKYFLAVTETGRKEVALYNQNGSERVKHWTISEVPTGITTDGEKLYVTAFDTQGGVYIITPDRNEEPYFIQTGSGACSPKLNAKGSKLYVSNQFSTTVSEVDLEKKKVIRKVSVVREPKNILLCEKRNLLFAANFLPLQPANSDSVAACISIIDLESFKIIKNVHLANGSNALRGMALTPDGNYLLISHNLGRFQVPTNQLIQGWMNTSAMSMINLNTLCYEGSVLLDDPERGAAGIWDIKCSAGKIVISHSGVHELSIIDYSGFIQKYQNYELKSQLAYDLRFLGALRQRIGLKGNGPRCFIIKNDEAIVPTYFSDTLNIVNIDSPEKHLVTAMAKNRIESDEFRGEKYFNDASFCFQNWQSCNGCHPGEGRTDGMNWDLMNDGLGNPKNCKSMLYSHITPKCMISGIRDSAEIAVRAGYKFIQFCEIPEESAVCVDRYLKSLKPVPSPYLINGKLSELAVKGRQVYNRLNCAECHSGPYFTDLKMHVIGKDVEFKQGWDTPTLCEVWRTAPYLFDGRAVTIKDVFMIHQHGIRSEVSEKEIDALVEYINSL